MRAATEKRLVRHLRGVLLVISFAALLLLALLLSCWHSTPLPPVAPAPRTIGAAYSGEPSCHALRPVVGEPPTWPVEESCYDRDESAAVVNCLSTLYYFHARRQAQWIAAAIDACAEEEETPR